MATHLNVPFMWGGVEKNITTAQKEMMADVEKDFPKIGLSINGSDADRSNLSDSEGVVEHLKKWIGPGKKYTFHDLAKLSEVVDEELPGLEMGATTLSRRPQRNVYNWLTDPLLVGPGLSRFIREKGHRYSLFGLARIIAYFAKRQALADGLISQDVNVGEGDYIWTKGDHGENFYSYKTDGEKKKEKEKKEKAAAKKKEKKEKAAAKKKVAAKKKEKTVVKKAAVALARAEEPVEETIAEPAEETVEETTAVPIASGAVDVRDQINYIDRLWDLHEKGALTTKEFSVMKSKLIASAN